MDTVPKNRYTAWAIGGPVAAAAALAVLVMTSSDLPAASTEPPAPQIFHDVITVASLLDSLPVVEDLKLPAEWSGRTEWPDPDPPQADEHGCDIAVTALRAELDSVTFTPGTNDCVVAHGILHDPYTASTVEYHGSAGNLSVAIDHIYPLSTAWALGASSWTPEQRGRFANDVQHNLIVADAQAITVRAARSLAEWLPPDRDAGCAFAAKYLRVAQIYDLPITRGDAAAATQVCGLRTDSSPTQAVTGQPN